MLDGLDPSLAYDFCFFGSRNSTETRITEYLVARLSYQHLTSDSNLPEADYSSNVVNLGVGFDF